ncbi:hypothetical protein B5807_06587 [Epicoccum nigrum]|uniref:Uncharacterized protein n=1 Tax=Epicoccum nigrum TaxID=105696 RepID=A0A1Y2LV66_EPING|nr:hypothetical protein B5807_06587 [Epicoccum nigrum]
MYLPLFCWTLPIYREPLWVETLISDFLGWTRYEISQIVNQSDVLMRVLNHPYWRFVDLFPIFIVISIVFFIIEFWQRRRDQAAEETVFELPGDAPEMRPETLSSTSRATAVDTTLRSGTPGTFVFPGPQTTFTDSSSSSGSSSYFGSPSSSSSRNFSLLKNTAPVFYFTLHKGMLLVADGTPANKVAEQDDDEYGIATSYDPPTRSWGNVRWRKNVAK